MPPYHSRRHTCEGAYMSHFVYVFQLVSRGHAIRFCSRAENVSDALWSKGQTLCNENQIRMSRLNNAHHPCRLLHSLSHHAHVAAAAVILLVGFVTHAFLDALGADPSLSLAKAQSACRQSSWLHVDTTPFFVLFRSAGAMVGLGVGKALAAGTHASAPLAHTRELLARYVGAVPRSWTIVWVLVQQEIPNLSISWAKPVMHTVVSLPALCSSILLCGSHWVYCGTCSPFNAQCRMLPSMTETDVAQPGNRYWSIENFTLKTRGRKNADNVPTGLAAAAKHADAATNTDGTTGKAVRLLITVAMLYVLAQCFILTIYVTFVACLCTYGAHLWWNWRCAAVSHCMLSPLC